MQKRGDRPMIGMTVQEKGEVQKIGPKFLQDPSERCDGFSGCRQSPIRLTQELDAVDTDMLRSSFRLNPSGVDKDGLPFLWITCRTIGENQC
jgi:hypothetical protein